MKSLEMAVLQHAHLEEEVPSRTAAVIGALEMEQSRWRDG
jgi:hypothetical protein